MASHDGLRAVVEDHHRDAAEVRERAAVAVEERLQILARGEAAERVARVRQRHMEGVDLRDAQVGEDLALVDPVHLGLGARDHLETAVHVRQLIRRDAEFLGNPGPGFLDVALGSLVVAGEPVLRRKPLVDHGGLHQDLRPQHRVDQRREPWPVTCRSTTGAEVRRVPRWQVLADRPPVQARLLGTLSQAHGSGLHQATKAP